MGLSLNQQIFELIKNSQKILITFKKNFSGDALSSALAIFLLLKKMDKQADIVCHDFVIAQNYAFLPEIGKTKSELSGLKKFIISLDIAENKIKNFSYDIKENKLNIYLTPEKLLDEKNIAFNSGKYKYDLVITLDTDNLESLGEIYNKHTDFFYSTPIINIDHNPENEQYGQINLIELTKTSSAEIIFDLIEQYDINLLDAEIATCLLTGMISKTKSFRSDSVTPRALNIASQLILNGAERDLIIQNLYRTKSINTLKLWGKVLARLKHDAAYKMAWSYLTQKDFIELNMQNPNLNEVIEELLTSAPEAEIIILFFENEKKTISGLVYTSKNYDSLHLAKSFNPQGTKTFATFELDKTDLLEASKEVIESIKANLPK
ncbi:MAG: DHH family phosphoesterase [Candidatus Parcubacteria bacterium]|nr:DHH family phosphoesterase [Candidatus Parcubacteria bacterium]